MTTIMPPKDPSDVDCYFVVWCDDTGINTGVAADDGILQGETIAASTWTVASGTITIDSSNKAAVTIRGVSYAISTVATVWVSGGTVDTDPELLNVITTSGSPSRTKSHTIKIPIRQQ